MTTEEAIAHVLSMVETDARDYGPLKPIRTEDGIALIGENDDEVFLLTIKPAAFVVSAPA